jgi:hypothetical protein
MNRIQNLTRLVGLAAFACLSLGFASKAAAELKICNHHPTQTIQYTHIISDPGCAGAKRQEGWAWLAPFTCQTVITGSMNGKSLQTFARTVGGQAWEGPIQNNFWAPLPNQAHSACHTGVQASCTNPGVTCEKRRFRGPFFYTTASVQITYSP